VGDARVGAVLHLGLEEEASFAVGGAAEGQGEHVSEIVGEVDLERVADLLGKILEPRGPENAYWLELLNFGRGSIEVQNLSSREESLDAH
jgi:hypothetical protein